MLNENLTREDAQWVLNVFQPIRRGTVNGSTIKSFVRAINIMTGKSLSAPSCSCEYKHYAVMANSYFDQFKDRLRDAV